MASEMKDTHHHIVEIAIENNHQKQIISKLEAIQDHPLMEISESPGHLLLLKLYQRDEHLFNQKIIRKESQLITLKSEIFNLCLFFFTFHMFFFTILFTSPLNEKSTNTNDNVMCRKFWVPMIVLLSTCLMMVFLVQVKLFRYWKVYEEMMREKSDSRALTRCVQELRMKGVSFDLSKEIGNGKRMKSSSVEIKWKPLSLCLKYFVTICFVGVTGLAVPVCRFIVCV